MTLATTRNNLVKNIKGAEGLRLKAYRDTVGKLSIGYGRNLDANGISKAEAEILLANDIADAIDDVTYRLPFVERLNEVRQDVLFEMCFNLGIQKLMGFSNTLRYVEAHEYEKAAENMLKSKWATQVKGRAKRLAEMMRTGEYPK